MSVEPHNEPPPQDYLAWEEEIPEEMQAEIASSRWTSRSILGGMAVCCLVLALGCYAGAKKWLDDSAPSAVSSPTGTVSQPVESELARSLREIETLKKAVSDQNATSQQMVIAIAALQAEQQELRQQIATKLVAKQKSALTTGSISPRTQTRAASKQADQAPLRLAAPRP